VKIQLQISRKKRLLFNFKLLIIVTQLSVLKLSNIACDDVLIIENKLVILHDK